MIAHYKRFDFSKALEAIWSLLGAVDKYIVEMKPWLLAKDDGAEAQAKLDATLYNSAEVLRLACALACPVLPDSTPKIWKTLGQPGALADYQLEDLAWGGLQRETKLGEPEALYPRLDVEKAVKEMQELEEEALKEQAEIMGKTPEAPAEEKPEPIVIDTPEIQIDDFFKVDMRVGLVKEARKHPDADKLLHLTIDIGEAEPRSICAGIVGAYEPEKLVGRKVGHRGEPEGSQDARHHEPGHDHRGLGG